MTITTKTYDDTVYKLVPTEPTEEMLWDIPQPNPQALGIYKAILSATPANLPGVVMHSGAQEMYEEIEQGYAPHMEVEQLRQRVKELEASQGYPINLALLAGKNNEQRKRILELEAQLAAQPTPETHQGAPSGTWLWGKLMDWCKKRQVAPANYDDLFVIVGESRELNKATITPEAIVKSALMAASRIPREYIDKPVKYAIANAILAIDPDAIIQAAKEGK